jgi:Pregnancy-associated plasma protein-A/Secretion system C-terminal sorting domain/SprB repeat/Ig-like domain CHU_C associated
MKKIIVLLACALMSITSYAQRTCGSQTYLADQLLANPLLQAQIDAVNQHAQQYSTSGKKTRTLVTIPVVFHVVYKTAAENISDAQCIANLNQLNLDFAHLNADTANTPGPFKAFAANTDIQFCLAVRDPLGNTTTGINHVPTTVNSWSTNNNVKFTASGGADAWPRDQYLNIWVCNLGSSLLGYATFPGGPANVDGVVALYTSVGSMANPNPAGGSYDLGRTVTHEVGHWLSMYHIWGDDGGACTGSDNVGDTPNQEDNNYGCPTYPLVDACTTVSPGVMFMNYMDYVDDACMNMFTSGQAARMASLFTVGGDRYPLLSSLGCTSVAPCSGQPVAGTAAAAGTDTLCTGSKTINLSGASSGTGISVQWQSSPNGTTWTNASGAANGISYSAPPSAGVMYYHAIVTCAGSGLSATSNAVAVYSYGVSGVSGNTTVCVGGNVTLTAQGVGAMNWYNSPTATTPVFVGNPYTTSVAGNTTFYVNSGSSSSYTVGPLNYSIGTNSTSTNLSNGLYFRVSSDIIIDSVFVYPGSAGNLVVLVQDSITSATVGSYTMPITAAQINTKVMVPIGISCPGVKTYKMLATGSTVTSLYRNTTGVTFPYTVPGIVSIFKNIANQNTNYRYFYNWYFRTGCATAKVPVAVSVAATTITASATPILCNGSKSVITANAGTGFTYTLNGGGGNTSGVFNNVAAGSYTVTGTSGSGCTASSTLLIAQPAPLSLNTTSVDNTSACNGSLTANAIGGTTPYQYTINGGASQTSNVFSNLCTGIYSVCVQDANACSLCLTDTVYSTNSITLYATSNASCANASSGSILLSVVGGVPTYQYKLNTGAYGNSNLFSNLAAGTYTVTGKDLNNNTSSLVITVTVSTLALSTSGTSAASAAACNGSVTGIVSGGSSPYTFNLNGGAYGTLPSYPNLCNGTYTVCTKDANGCIVCNTYAVPIIIPIALSIPNTTQACPGFNNGSITALATFGTTPYQYQINNAGYSTNALFNGLANGIYTIMAKDANNITTSTTVSLNQSVNLTLNANGNSQNCAGICDGSVSGSAVTGSGIYQYSLNGAAYQLNGTYNNLCAGSYTIQTIDGNGCTKSGVVTLTAPSAMSGTHTVTDVACHYQTNGSVTSFGAGGTAPYQYAISPNAYGTFNTFTGLAGGVYTMLIKDAKNCVLQSTVTVVEPPLLLATGTTNNTTGTVTINATGGTPQYSYSVNGGASQASNVFNGLGAGSYSMMVVDARGCKYVTATVLQAPEDINSIELSNAIGIYPNPSNGIIHLQINSHQSIGVLKIRVIDELGKIVARDIMEVNGKVAEKTLNLQHLAEANYLIQITDEHQGVYLRKIVIQ